MDYADTIIAVLAMVVLLGLTVGGMLMAFFVR